jgi:hypothetical protein
MNAQRFDRLGLFLEAGSTLACSVARNAPLVHRQSIRPHLMPIALMAGGSGLVQYVLSLTGADFRCGVHAATLVRRAAER